MPRIKYTHVVTVTRPQTGGRPPVTVAAGRSIQMDFPSAAAIQAMPEGQVLRVMAYDVLPLPALGYVRGDIVTVTQVRGAYSDFLPAVRSLEVRDVTTPGGRGAIALVLEGVGGAQAY